LSVAPASSAAAWNADARRRLHQERQSERSERPLVEVPAPYIVADVEPDVVEHLHPSLRNVISR
jgi:hypothetical protein